MNSEEYKEKYKHFRVIYISDDGFWIDGKEVLKRIGKKHYPEFYFLGITKPSATFYERTSETTEVLIKTRKYKRYRFRAAALIPDAMIEWMIRQGRHKTEAS